jgi:hypothetical protein
MIKRIKLDALAHHAQRALIHADPVLMAKYAAMVSAFAQVVQLTALVSAWLRRPVAEAVGKARYASMVSASARKAQKNAIIVV